MIDGRGRRFRPSAIPLVRTAARWATADRVWWNGPPWTVLRNASCYLWHVMDYGRDEDIGHTLRDRPASSWRRALDEARPGLLSKGSYVLWSLVFDRMAPGSLCDWPDGAHFLDCRMLAGESRARMHERHRRGDRL